MTAPLDDRDATRLVKLLGLLNSEYAAERAAAGAKADALVRDRGLTWADVIAPHNTSSREFAPDEISQEREIAFCLQTPGVTVWERQFLHGIKGRHRLSEKQRQTLREIAGKCRAQRRGRAA